MKGLAIMGAIFASMMCISLFDAVIVWICDSRMADDDDIAIGLAVVNGLIAVVIATFYISEVLIKF